MDKAKGPWSLMPEAQLGIVAAGEYALEAARALDRLADLLSMKVEAYGLGRWRVGRGSSTMELRMEPLERSRRSFRLWLRVNGEPVELVTATPDEGAEVLFRLVPHGLDMMEVEFLEWEYSGPGMALGRLRSVAAVDSSVVDGPAILLDEQDEPAESGGES